jgi:hypothetical protein
MNLVDTNPIAFDELSESNQLYILKTIKKHADEMPQIEADILRDVEFLKENGFVEGEHFKYEIETYKRQDYVFIEHKDYGSRDRFFFEYDIKHGYVALKYKRFHGEGGMHNYSTNIEIQSDGLIRERGNVMNRTGSYKPKTIMDRLIYLSELANNMEASYNKKVSLLETATSDFAKFYPTAEITTHKNYDWRSNNYNSNADVIRVQFPSGSYVKIVISSNGDEIIESHDVELSSLTMTQTLNKFRDQKPQEDAKI